MPVSSSACGAGCSRMAASVNSESGVRARTGIACSGAAIIGLARWIFSVGVGSAAVGGTAESLTGGAAGTRDSSPSSVALKLKSLKSDKSEGEPSDSTTSIEETSQRLRDSVMLAESFCSLNDEVGSS